MITLIKAAVLWSWERCPMIIKIYLGAVVVPNILVFSTIFFIFGIPFLDNRIHSHTKPMKEMRDRQLETMVKNQVYELKLIHSEMSRFNRQQDIMMQELMRRSAPNNP